MTSIELQLCDIQGRLFKLSAQRGFSSAEFIKIFMKFATAKALASTYNRLQWAGDSRAVLPIGTDLQREKLCKLVPFLYGGQIESVK